jgi:hypothetical protein
MLFGLLVTGAATGLVLLGRWYRRGDALSTYSDDDWGAIERSRRNAQRNGPG